MAIQILGLRDYVVSGKTKKREVFFENNWRAETVGQLFADIELYLRAIPEDEKYNLYYTVASCLEEPGRKIAHQTVIPFDIDDIEVEKAEEVAKVALDAINAEWSKTGVVFSGNGVQLLIDQNVITIETSDQFDDYRQHYKACCARIEIALVEAGLSGKVDTSVWSPARLMRLPGTENRKPTKTTRTATLLQGYMATQSWSLEKQSGLIKIAPKDHIAQSVVNRLPKPDTKAVLNECEFIKWCAAEPAKVREAQWYAMLSVVARLDDGKELGHKISNGHPGYQHAETDLKIEQALTNSGPRTCANIGSLFDCSGCKHFQSDKIRSPIMIQGPDYILTEKSGFHQIVVDANGNQKPGKPQVDDLRKYFARKYKYITMTDSKMVFVFDGKCWREMENVELESFAYEHFNPKPSSNTRHEFVSTIQCTNLKSSDWFLGSTDRRINFNNGILNIDTGELEPHSAMYGFRYVLPYNYDAQAICPTFDRFMRDITCGREALSKVLLEFMGYAFSGDECWEHKALMLLGQGSNGKSTLMQVLEMLAGEGTYSAVTLSDMKNETMRQQLDGRLFNMAEETSPTALVDSSIFKNLVSGGQIIVKKLYKQPYTIRNRCKLIFSCNELPLSKDKTGALYRRMLIVPFDNKFEGENKDPLIRQKLKDELPGIFNRVIDGYTRFRKQKHFTDAEELREQLAIYEQSNDAVLNFFQDEIKVLEFDFRSTRTLTKDIYQAYRFYSEDVHGERPMAAPQFFSLLKRRIADYDKRFIREAVNGVRERKLIGIVLANKSGNI